MRKPLLRITLFLSDVLGISSMWFLAYLIRYTFEDLFVRPAGPFQHHLIFLPAVLVIWIGTVTALGLYKSKTGIYRIEEDIALLKAMVIAGSIMMTGAFLLADLQVSRSALTFSIFLIYFALQGNRFWLAMFRRFLVKRGLLTIRVLIVGAGVSGARLMHRMGAFPSMGYKVVGFADNAGAESTTIIDGVSVLGTSGEIESLIERHNIEEVYIASPGLTPLKIIQLIDKLREQKVEFKVVSNLLGVLAGGVNLEEGSDVPIIDVKRGELGPVGHFIKGLIDKIFSLFLMFALLPIWAIIYAGLKLESREGPVIIRQRRVGLGGGEFNMYKFRTMYPTVPKYQTSPASDDDIRVTPFGKILRKTALDETAQLINVLQGKMSLVGPRPDMPFVVGEYAPWQRFRLAAKPGITGLWQLAGRHDIPPHENIEFDFYYIQNQSILLDLVILMKTLPVLVLGRAIY